MKNNKKNFQHDGCKSCQYLGSDEQYDYYSCPQRDIRTYIARFGNEPWEYLSCPIDHIFGKYDKYPKDDPCAEAYRLYWGIKK